MQWQDATWGKLLRPNQSAIIGIATESGWHWVCKRSEREDCVPAPSQMPTSRRNRLLVAEDDQALRELMVQVLRSDGHEVVAVTNGNDLLYTLAGSLNPKTGTDPFDLVISDIRMPGQSGLNAFAQVGYGPRMPPVVFMTAFGDEDVHERAVHLGAIGVLDKPVDFDELRLFVKSYLAHGHA